MDLQKIGTFICEKRKQTILAVLHSIFAELILVLFIAFCVYLNTMQGTYATDYMDIPALLVILGAIGIVLIATGLCKDFFRIAKISLHSSTHTSLLEINRALCAAIVAVLTAFFSGTIMSIMSTVGTLVSITPANIGAVYVAFSIDLLGILYGLAFCLLMLPFIAKLYKLKYTYN